MAFKLDFEKLRDPAWKAEVKAKEDARQAEEARKEAELRAAVELCEGHWEALTPKERSLVSGCRFRLNAFGLVSEKQAVWLSDIAKRLQPATSKLSISSGRSVA